MTTLDDVREVVREEVEREQAEAAKPEHVALVANSASAPFDRDDLEDMDAEAVATLAETYDRDPPSAPVAGERRNIAPE